MNTFIVTSYTFFINFSCFKYRNTNLSSLILLRTEPNRAHLCCEVLYIKVKNRTNILYLINTMCKLRTLIVRSGVGVRVIFTHAYPL